MKPLTKLLTIVAIVIAAATTGALAEAAIGWRVFASSIDSGAYGAYSSASASASKPKALAIRASKEANITWNLSCDGTTHARAGQVVTAAVATSGSCRIFGTADTDEPGTMRLELLKR